ncbi:UPF0272 protein [Clostridia bacterium]|nr:UPF0272 protein [Clostridia bacterium]
MTLYIECAMGAAGDMLTAALLELCDGVDLNTIGIPGVEFVTEESTKCGIVGTHVSVKVHGLEEHEHEHDHHDHGHHHHHDHSSLHGIEHIIGHLNVPDSVKADAIAVYKLIAEAEGHVHNRPVAEIHFHEVGALDAIADVTAVCWLLRKLNPDRIVASPVHVGAGTVKCAHGILPVPAPATAYLLRDIPAYGGAVKSELCTPTGAALLKHFATSFGDMPVMSVSKIGYGMGRKDFERANCVRVFLGDTADNPDQQEVAELRANIDDMTAEELGFALETLMDGGALDAWTAAIGMKKSRPGTMLSCLCRVGDVDKFTDLMFRHTTTLGVRSDICRRAALVRREENGVKVSTGHGVTRRKVEYEQAAKIAREQGLTLWDARDIIAKL